MTSSITVNFVINADVVVVKALICYNYTSTTKHTSKLDATYIFRCHISVLLRIDVIIVLLLLLLHVWQYFHLR